MYHELNELYGGSLPPLEITTFSDIPSFRTNKPQWLIDLNPNGKVPTMTHDSVVMFEGGAICSYFLDCFDVDKKLLPRDSACVAMYYQMAFWCASTVDNLTATSSPIGIVLDKDAAKPMDSVAVNQKYFDEVFVPFFNKQLAVSGGPFFCGEYFTAVDVIVGYTLLIAKEKMAPAWLDGDKYPAMDAYLALLRNRPALLKALLQHIEA
jgi:glutathione S-transferase